jgi:hypothetical protein
LQRIFSGNASRGAVAARLPRRPVSLREEKLTLSRGRIALGFIEQRHVQEPKKSYMAKQQNTVAKKLRENEKRQKAQEKLARRKAKSGGSGSDRT